MTHHIFQPSDYPTTFGSHPAALRIADGDSVVTTTVDASGADAQGQIVAGRPNPLTGPFYIEGAEPGDTLQVHLDRLMPNRQTGYSYTALTPQVVDPLYAAGRDPTAPGYLPERQRVEWRIDLAENRAMLLTPFGKLSSFSQPLSPLLGCLGVAPADGQAISSATSGPYGGNMDYRGLVAGVTLYFPVFVPGALLYLGDGHAVQADGEILGTGIETTFEVQFTVRLLKGKTIRWPRGENQHDIFTLGNARPLEQALQHATTEMLRWLQEDYRLTAEEANFLLGQCVAYDLGNIYDPAYTMVCKMPKSALL